MQQFKMTQTNTSNQPHCPYCNSTNLTKVSGTSRFASTLMFGIGSKKVGKQWKCNNCKSYFKLCCHDFDSLNLPVACG